MTHVSGAEGEALLAATPFETGLRRIPGAWMDTVVVSELERRGLVDTEVVVLWRRTPEGEQLASELAEKKRRAA